MPSRANLLKKYVDLRTGVLKPIKRQKTITFDVRKSSQLSVEVQQHSYEVIQHVREMISFLTEPRSMLTDPMVAIPLRSGLEREGRTPTRLSKIKTLCSVELGKFLLDTNINVFRNRLGSMIEKSFRITTANVMDFYRQSKHPVWFQMEPHSCKAQKMEIQNVISRVISMLHQYPVDINSEHKTTERVERISELFQREFDTRVDSLKKKAKRKKPRKHCHSIRRKRSGDHSLRRCSLVEAWPFLPNPCQDQYNLIASASTRKTKVTQKWKNQKEKVSSDPVRRQTKVYKDGQPKMSLGKILHQVTPKFSKLMSIASSESSKKSLRTASMKMSEDYEDAGKWLYDSITQSPILGISRLPLGRTQTTKSA